MAVLLLVQVGYYYYHYHLHAFQTGDGQVLFRAGRPGSVAR